MTDAQMDVAHEAMHNARLEFARAVILLDDLGNAHLDLPDEVFDLLNARIDNLEKHYDAAVALFVNSIPEKEDLTDRDAAQVQDAEDHDQAEADERGIPVTVTDKTAAPRTVTVPVTDKTAAPRTVTVPVRDETSH